MITVLCGDDSYEVQVQLRQLEAAHTGETSRIDGTTISLRDIPDLLMGTSLFSDSRLVIIRDLSQNAAVWSKLSEWLPRVSDDIHLVLIETKLDKRTSTYKALKDAADLREYHAWGVRDQALAIGWLKDEAAARGVALSPAVCRYLVQRVGVDKWTLSSSLEQLALVEGTLDEAKVAAYIARTPQDTVFELLEAAFAGDVAQLQQQLRTLERTEDPFTTFALISSQVFQLLAVAEAGPGDSPEKDFAIHPFVAKKLSAHARSLGATRVRDIARAVAQVDSDMKRSKAGPWVLVERALLSITQ